MRRLPCFLLFIIISVQFAWSEQPPRFHSPDVVMRAWEEAVRSRDLDGFANCYWPDASLWRQQLDGHMMEQHGIGPIIGFQARIFEEVGHDLGQFRLPEPQIHHESFTGLPMFIYDF